MIDRCATQIPNSGIFFIFSFPRQPGATFDEVSARHLNLKILNAAICAESNTREQAIQVAIEIIR